MARIVGLRIAVIFSRDEMGCYYVSMVCILYMCNDNMSAIQMDEMGCRVQQMTFSV